MFISELTVLCTPITVSVSVLWCRPFQFSYRGAVTQECSSRLWRYGSFNW